MDNNNNINNNNDSNNNKFLLPNGNNFNIENDKQEQIINYLNNSSKYYNSNQNNSTTQSNILDTTSYQNNNNNNNNVNNNNNNSNNNLYLPSNNIEDHELDLWLREFTMDNFPLNANNIPNIGNSNSNNNSNNNNNLPINNNPNNNNNNNNIIDNQYNSSNNNLLNRNPSFVETAAQDKYLKIRKLKNVAIEERAKKNGEINNYPSNLSLLNQSFGIVSNNNNSNINNSNNNNSNNTSNTYNNKSYLNEASTSSKLSVSDTMDIYKTNPTFQYPDGYKQVSNFPQFLMNENRQNRYSNNNYSPNDFSLNKKDNIFDSFNIANSNSDKSIPFMAESNSSVSKSSEVDGTKGSNSKGKELTVEEKLNDKRKR